MILTSAHRERPRWIFRTVVCLPVVFTLYDLGEILTVHNFWSRVHLNLPEPIDVKDYLNTNQFSAAVIPPLVLLVIAAGIILRLGLTLVSYITFTTYMSLLFLNPIIHLLQDAVIRMYLPGEITSIALFIPYTLVSVKYVMKNHLLPNAKTFVTLRVGAVLSPSMVMRTLLAVDLLGLE
jgi:hypothetical protein